MLAYNMLFVGLALVVTVFGIGLLQTAWRLKTRSWPLVIVCWSLLASSIPLWHFNTAADKGVALAVVAVVMIALLFLCVTAIKAPLRPSKRMRERRAAPAPTGSTTIVRRIGSGLLIGPAAGLVALAVATSTFVSLQAFGIEHTLNLSISSFAFPLAWAALAVSSAYQTKLLPKSIQLFAVALIALAFVELST